MGKIVLHSVIIIIIHFEGLCDVYEHLSPEALDEVFDDHKGHNALM